MANIRVKNQKPNVLNANYVPSFKGDFDLKKYMTSVFSKTLRQPMVTSAPVDIIIDNNNATDDDVFNLMLRCCTGVVDSQAEDDCKNLFSQILLYYNKNTKLLLKDLFAVSAGVESGLDEPDAVTIYTPATDIIPASLNFLAGKIDYPEFFASFAFYCRLEVFGVYFVNEIEFENFKNDFQIQINLIQGNLSATCLSLIADFMKLDLKGLTESFKIRNTESENIEEYSFARVLMTNIMLYCSNANLAGIMPFDFEELFCPKNIVFFNVDKFAHSSPNQISNEIKDINDAIAITNKVNMVSNNTLQKLAPIARSMKKSQGMAANALSNIQGLSKAAMMKFKKKIMSNTDYLKIIVKILEKMKTEKRTQNVYKCVKSSFAKPNRRNPDDYNLQGKIISTKYRPDLHLYLDTSGSISEQNYEASVKMAIQLAKKLDVNLYFNTFSHVLSQTTLLQCANKSTAQIYAEFQKTPKVTGGTEFEQIWHFINASKKRQDELSIMITDFEWSARSVFVKHPKNLYYMPCANIDWRDICDAARHFAKSCEHNEPNIIAHILA